jgi:hypothetical protein
VLEGSQLRDRRFQNKTSTYYDPDKRQRLLLELEKSIGALQSYADEEEL